jgi:transcriptional regulator GlxA family with amidase domain
VLAKIADVFRTQTLRTYLIGAQNAGLVQLAPLQDPAVARAVELRGSRPHERWTVASLAREVGMSRTMFAGRFGDLVGQTPIRYLTTARLGRAAGYLATTYHSLRSIARRTGYDSEASLSKAFKREFGRSPGEYRRQSKARPILIDGEPQPASQSAAGGLQLTGRGEHEMVFPGAPYQLDAERHPGGFLAGRDGDRG